MPIASHLTKLQNTGMDQLELTLTEADVEARVILPLLTTEEFLGIPQENIRSKQYLAPTAIDKKAGKNYGSYPDFAVVVESVQIALIEAKAPNVAAEVGYRELITYAAHLNGQYPPGVNPVQRILATNGRELLAGFADSNPKISCLVSDLFVGGLQLTNLRELMGKAVIEQLHSELRPKLRPPRLYLPFAETDRRDALHAQIQPNTFAAPLAPSFRRFLTSKQQNNDPDIYRFGYVEDKLLKSYDATLSNLMKERIVDLRGSLSIDIEPSKRREPHIEEKIQDFATREPSGELQLLTGSVGTGKSLFVRRYKELLQNPELSSVCHWAFIDFNNWTFELPNKEEWVTRKFCASFAEENDFDIYDRQTQNLIFADRFYRSRAVYEELSLESPELAAKQKADDRKEWLEDPNILAQSICQYFTNSKRETLIVVLDNVDRQSTEDQVKLFELALWFMDFSKAFVILSLRDDTYERFKDRKPFDTFRSGVSFHVTPPRLIDVVKRRIELISEEVKKTAAKKLTYQTSNNLNITYDKERLTDFLKTIYLRIFDENGNVGKFIQGICGRDVRKGLEIFDAVLRSGHLSEEVITSTLQGTGSGEFEFSEEILLRALMRGNRLFYSDNSGFVANIFHTSDDWDRPNNLLCSEILYKLYEDRLKTGTMGLQGYFSITSLAKHFESFGFTRNDVFKCCDYLIGHALVESDKLFNSVVGFEDNLRITYSGFLHQRFLVDRVEYVSSVLAVTPIADQSTARRVGEMLAREVEDRTVTFEQRRQVVTLFARQLDAQYKQWVQWFPGFAGRKAGSSYLLAALDRAAGVSSRSGVRVPNVLDQL